MIHKVIHTEKDARRKLFNGAKTVANILAKTLGPAGKNVIIQKAYSAPEIVNDAGTIARHIVLSDPTEDLGAQTIVESTMKTNDRAGDARTTTAVLAGKIIEHCEKIIDEGGPLNGSTSDVINISRSILEAKNVVIEKLKKMARPLGKDELVNVVSTSIGKLYPEYAYQIAEMVDKVGLDGYIAVEDNYGTKYGVESTLIEGMRFLGSYVAPVMITNTQKESVWEDSCILVTNYRIESVGIFNDLIEDLRQRGIKKLIIIAEGYEKDFIIQVASSYIKNLQAMQNGQAQDFFKILAIKAPSLTTDQFQDVTAFCDAKFINKNTGDTLQRVIYQNLGFAKKIIVDEDDTNITGGRGKVSERLVLLKAELELEKDPSFKEQLKRRIGALTSGFGIIRVGASTETERGYVKKKITDAVNSAKGALEEGVVKGGGIALKDIAEELGKENILYSALIEPAKLIKDTTGGTEIPSTVLDPLKSTRLAVENACSVAAHLITCEASIADKRATLWDELNQRIAPADNEDFRADENQELKYRT